MLNTCPACLEKQQHIDQLLEENRRLKQQLRYRQRQAEQGPFGSSTPSSKIPIKSNRPEENQKKQGGAKPGHAGHGRKAIPAQSADRIESIEGWAHCPQCRGPLEEKGVQQRSVLDSRPMRAERILYRLTKQYCPRCQKTLQAPAPGVLPKSFYGNQLITQVIFSHYQQGIPLGQVCEQIGVAYSSVIDILHRMARRFKGVLPVLVDQYRTSEVRHADETGWRVDGRSGYAWLFATPRLSVFLFRPTRSARVVKEVLGETPLPGALVVDRYNAYNRSPCALQYCYAHLLREVEDLAQEFPDLPEVMAFTASLIPLLAQAMHLHSQTLSDRQYYRRARQLKTQVLKIVEAPAQQLGIRRIQDIFTENQHRLYLWVDHRNIPADNNRAERELRPTVIARKVSFGSQSDAGAKTREILMSLIHTLSKRFQDPRAHFKSFLDRLVLDPQLDEAKILFDSG